jgi:hypothetical protein
MHSHKSRDANLNLIVLFQILVGFTFHAVTKWTYTFQQKALLHFTGGNFPPRKMKWNLDFSLLPIPAFSLAKGYSQNIFSYLNNAQLIQVKGYIQERKLCETMVIS